MALLEVTLSLIISPISLATPAVARPASTQEPQLPFHDDPSCQFLIDTCVKTAVALGLKNPWSSTTCVAGALCYGAGEMVDLLCKKARRCPSFQDDSQVDFTEDHVVLKHLPALCPKNEVPFKHQRLVQNAAFFCIALDFIATHAFEVPTPSLSTHKSKHESSSSGSPSRSTSLPVWTSESATLISFNPNPAPASAARSETFVAPGITTEVAIPTSTTVIDLSSAGVVNTTSTATKVFGGSTIFATVTSSSTTDLHLTIGPGGGIIGAIPSSVSQPGLSAQVFDTNPILAPGATKLTFTGTGGYSTVVPVPTGTSTTIPIGASFGGGSIELGMDGMIIGSLPPGISEVGALSPVPDPVGSHLDPRPTNEPDEPSNFPSSSSPSHSSSASSSAACAVATVAVCEDACNGEPEDSVDSKRRGMSLRKRTSNRGTYSPPADHKCTLNILQKWVQNAPKGPGSSQRQTSTLNPGTAVTTYERSASSHKAFALRTYTGVTFDMATSRPNAKPKNFMTEHIFEFQMFALFVQRLLADPRNKDLQGCDGTWIDTFYASPEIKQVVAKIDSIANLDDYINRAKLYTVGHTKTIGQAGLSQWTDTSRAGLLNLMRGCAAVIPYLTANAPAFKTTVEGIIKILQAYDLRMGSPQQPPLAVQFHEHMNIELEAYETSGRALALNLGNRFAAAIQKNMPFQMHF
ncbi:hypothetical protein B0H19DRAFT_1274134 [Mycena capillaripes]|nr:hypothetical protein B0H19DRAFT_1274134 [Mycena capillaripes]